MKLLDSLSRLIVEGASYNDLYDAVKNKKVLVIFYDGDEPGGKGQRLIEPVALGESLAGNQVLRAWDYEGASHRAYIGEKPLPSWRLFRLDKILSAKDSGYGFTIKREGYNVNGDKKMRKLYVKADFSVNFAQNVEPEKVAPAEPTKSWIDAIKSKFAGWFSRFFK